MMDSIQSDLQSYYYYEQYPSRTTDINGRVKIQYEKEGFNSAKPITICELFHDISKKYGQNPALAYQNSEKEWQTVTYQEYFEKINKIAKIFIKLGFQPHDSVGIIAFNCPEWFYSALGAISAGGIIAGIYTTNSSEAVQYVLEKSDATICIVDNKKQMDKIREIKQNLPKLKTVIQINGPFDDFIGQEDGYYKWSDIEQIKTDNDLQIELEERIKQIVPNECCSIIFTSATTGRSKGVMISHDNVIFGIKAAKNSFENIKIGEEISVSYLPLNHIAAQHLDIFLPILCAGSVYFADRDALKGTLIKTLIKARPTRFLGVPRIWEKFHEKLISIEANANSLNSFLMNLGKKMVYNYNISKINRGHGNYFIYLIGKKFTNKVKASLGLDRCRTYLTGAAPTNHETKKYFCSINIILFELYGLSEVGAVGFGNSSLRNFDTIGNSIIGTDVKINNPDEKGIGELYVKSRSVFMGYLKEPKETTEAFDTDWFKTGDLAHMDTNEDLYIVGRVKELIITAGGENIPFLLIENAVKSELSGISNAMIIGDKLKFLSILLTIKTEMDPETGGLLDKLQFESLQWMQELNLNYTTLSDILEAGPCPIVLKSIQDGIDRYNNKAYSTVHTIKKFVLLPHDFSMGTDELGPTLKLKRSFVLDKYKDIITKLYE